MGKPLKEILMPWRRKYNKRVANVGERQAKDNLKDIRADHVGRYKFACDYVKPTDKVLDAACGVGYGSYLIAKTVKGAQLTAVDISDEALAYGKKFYKHKNVQYLNADITKLPLPEGSFDVVTTFETIEHIDDDNAIIAAFFKALKPGGVLLGSTPNEDLIPHSPELNPYHFRHHTQATLTKLLTDNGFVDVQGFGQPDRHAETVEPGWNGLFHIVVARKPV